MPAPVELGQVLPLLLHRTCSVSDEQLYQPELAKRNIITPVPRAVSHSRWHSLHWKFEVLSWLGSLCFIIATIILLKILNVQPLPHLQFGLTPNAIIGLLSTFSEALLMASVSTAIGQIKWLRALKKRPMDDFRVIYEATRRPWGSIRLLVRGKGGYVLPVILFL
jgi:hypothetical protein